MLFMTSDVTVLKTSIFWAKKAINLFVSSLSLLLLLLLAGVVVRSIRALTETIKLDIDRLLHSAYSTRPPHVRFVRPPRKTGLTPCGAAEEIHQSARDLDMQCTHPANPRPSMLSRHVRPRTIASLSGPHQPNPNRSG